MLFRSIYSNSINKFDLLNLLNEHYNLNLTIKQFIDKDIIDRTLSTKKDLIGKLNIKNIKQQIKEL